MKISTSCALAAFLAACSSAPSGAFTPVVLHQEPFSVSARTSKSQTSKYFQSRRTHSSNNAAALYATPGDTVVRKPRPRYIPGEIPDPDYVRIFDTTLRDGEQSPGATLTSQEKLEILITLKQFNPNSSVSTSD